MESPIELELTVDFRLPQRRPADILNALSPLVTNSRGEERVILIIRLLSFKLIMKPHALIRQVEHLPKLLGLGDLCGRIFQKSPDRLDPTHFAATEIRKAPLLRTPRGLQQAVFFLSI